MQSARHASAAGQDGAHMAQPARVLHIRPPATAAGRWAAARPWRNGGSPSPRQTADTTVGISNRVNVGDAQEHKTTEGIARVAATRSAIGHCVCLGPAICNQQGRVPAACACACARSVSVGAPSRDCKRSNGDLHASCALCRVLGWLRSPIARSLRQRRGRHRLQQCLIFRAGVEARHTNPWLARAQQRSARPARTHTKPQWKRNIQTSNKKG